VKFDSSDVVQSVWASLLQGSDKAGWRFQDAAHLRAFLVQMTRNRLIDRVRKHKTAIDREQRLDQTTPGQVPMSREPRASDVAQAGELWNRMLALCPAEHHPILYLKREGFGLTEIAARTGLHEGSVRRILRKLSRQLAMEQPATDSPH
jgi:RNA polymerase sigma-70 factor (ECF subfamily)